MSDVSRKPLSPPHRIALLMPRANVHTRGIFRGVTRFVRPFRAWNFHLGLPDAKAVALLRRWKPAGILATIPDAALEARVSQLGIPLVNCSSDLVDGEADRVVTDNAAVGRLAAEHLIERGLPYLGFCGESSSLASQKREEFFIGRARELGRDVHHFSFGRGSILAGDIGWAVSSRDRGIQRWVRGLPKPISLFACHDQVAMLLTEVCSEIGISIPGQVAILGVDDDPMLCEMAYPSLSSVQTAHELIGFEAARRLHEIMQGNSTKVRTQKISPIGVCTRQSTELKAIDDTLVAEALRYVSEHADQPIRVADVVQYVGISRRSLEYRIRARTGRTVLASIQEAHIALANELLASTNDTLDQIAESCGFNSRERFSTVYRQITGQTPRSAFPKTSLDPSM